jgi:myosin heavy subunit
MSVVKECYICASVKRDKMSYYYEEPKEIQEENMKNVAIWNTVIQLAHQISDLRAENARLERQRVEELKRAEESKKKEMKDILQKLHDTQKEVEVTKAQHEKIIQQREEKIEEEKMWNFAMCNAMKELAHKVSDLRVENDKLGRTVTQLQGQLQAERAEHSEEKEELMERFFHVYKRLVDKPIEPQQEARLVDNPIEPQQEAGLPDNPIEPQQEAGLPDNPIEPQVEAGLPDHHIEPQKEAGLPDNPSSVNDFNALVRGPFAGLRKLGRIALRRYGNRQKCRKFKALDLLKKFHLMH